MTPRKATAYLKGIRAAKALRRRDLPVINPYEQGGLRDAFIKGVRDYEDHREDAEYFLKQAEGLY